MKNSTARWGLGIAAFAAALGAVTPAMALEPKDCLPLIEMNQRLEAEGQKTVLAADNSVLHNPTGLIKDAWVTLNLEAVTSNKSGDEGYQLKGDRPKIEYSTTVCVTAKLKNIRFFDNSKPGIPPAAQLGGLFNVGLQQNEALGTRPMILADTIHKNADGSIYNGRPLIILGNVQNKNSGVMYTRMDDGKMGHVLDLDHVEFTNEGLTHLPTQPQLALNEHKAPSLNPKDCLPLAEMNAALAAEGQKTVISGDQTILNNPTGKIKDAWVALNLEAVTSNKAGTDGYQLTGDRPKAESSTKICIAAKLKNLHFFDHSKPGVPRAAQLGGLFNVSLQQDEALGTRPMFLADTIHINEDGSISYGRPLMIEGNVENNNSGIMVTRMDDGKAGVMMVLHGVEFTPQGRTHLPTQP